MVNLPQLMYRKTDAGVERAYRAQKFDGFTTIGYSKDYRLGLNAAALCVRFMKGFVRTIEGMNRCARACISGKGILVRGKIVTHIPLDPIRG